MASQIKNFFLLSFFLFSLMMGCNKASSLKSEFSTDDSDTTSENTESDEPNDTDSSTGNDTDTDTDTANIADDTDSATSNDAIVWQELNGPSEEANLHHLAFSAPNSIYAVGNWYHPSTDTTDGVLLKHDGLNWNTLHISKDASFTSLWAINEMLLIAVTSDFGKTSQLLQYVNDQISVLLPNLPVSQVGIWGSSAEDIFLVGSDYGDNGIGTGQILHFDGNDLVETLQVENRRIDNIWGLSNSSLFTDEYDTQSRRSIVRHFDGSLWQEQLQTEEDVNIFDIWGLNKDSVFAVAGFYDGNANTRRGILYKWNGTAWTQEDTGVSALRFTSIFGTSADNIFLSGFEAGETFEGDPIIFHFDGSHWRETILPDSTTSINDFIQTPSGILALGSNGQLLLCCGE